MQQQGGNSKAVRGVGAKEACLSNIRSTCPFHTSDLCQGLAILLGVLGGVTLLLTFLSGVWSFLICRARPGDYVCYTPGSKAGATSDGYAAHTDSALAETPDIGGTHALIPGNPYAPASSVSSGGRTCCTWCNCQDEPTPCTIVARVAFWVVFGLLALSTVAMWSLAIITADLYATTLPDLAGELKLPGMRSGATIHREDSGMFHITADNLHDAVFAQGVAHAQYRLWQMDFQRRVGRGTLSEAVGEGGLKIDKFMRTLGVLPAAEAAAKLLDTTPVAAEMVDGYLAGVNAYIDSAKAALPFEMKLLGVKPSHFTRADSMVWAKLMSFDLSENWSREKTRHYLLVGRNLTTSRIEQLMPWYQTDRFPTVLDEGDLLPIPPAALKGASTPAPGKQADEEAARILRELAAERTAAGVPGAPGVPEAAPTPAAAQATLSERISQALRARPVKTSCGSGADLAGAMPHLRFAGAYIWSLLTGDVAPLASHLLSPKALTVEGALFSGKASWGGPRAQASNNWVVHGNRTVNGKPLMANDPHLSLSAPSIWIVNHLHIAGPNPSGEEAFDIIGASFPILPGVVIGHNSRISWAVTNTGADVQDLYVMNDTASGGQSYWFNGTWTPYAVTPQVIKVKGKADVHINVRSSHYGNVVTDNDVINATLAAGATMSLRWVSTDLSIQDTTMSAFMGLDFSANYTAWRNALRLYGAPSQNFIFADATTGDIAYQLPGWVPHRHPSHSGAYPVPGTGLPQYEWQGRIPFDALPASVNPSKGYIVTANNKVTPPSYDAHYFITPHNLGWNALSVGYRAKRITEMVVSMSENDPHNATLKLDLDGMAAIQTDYKSNAAADVISGIALVQASQLTAGGRSVQQKLLAWDQVMSVGSSEAVLFAYLVSELTVLGTAEAGGEHWVQFGFLYNALHSDAGNATDPACTKLGFATCTAFAARALDRTAEFETQLKGRLSSPDSDIKLPLEDGVVYKPAAVQHWGKGVHPAVFAHAILGQTPLACLADRSVAHGGDWSTVNVGAFQLPSQAYAAQLRSGDEPKDDEGDDEDEDDDVPLFVQSAGPSYRGLYDLADLQSSRFLNPLGQSGNILSKQFDNLLGKWSTGHYLPMQTSGYKSDSSQKLS